MVCTGLDLLTDPSISDFLAFFNDCDYYFWAKILVAFWIVLSSGMYFTERKQRPNPDFISILGVSSLACAIVATAMTFLNMLPLDVFIKLILLFLVFIIIWLWKD